MQALGGSYGVDATVLGCDRFKTSRPARARVAAVLEIPLLRLVEDLPLPAYARVGDAGADLVAAEDVILQPGGGRALVPTGAAIAIPFGYAGFVQPYHVEDKGNPRGKTREIRSAADCGVYSNFEV